MAKHNPANERIKRDYFRLLKEGRGYDEASIDAVAQAIHRYEESTRFKPFDRFHIEQAIAFKRWLPEQLNKQTGRPLAKATLLSTMRSLREFILWLSGQPGFRARINHGDANYFRLSERESRAAKRTLAKPVPTLEQIEMVLQSMPAETALQRRDRAVVAFVILTGARDAAVASFKLKHLDMAERLLTQDGREVRTKGAKTILTWFFPVGGSAEPILTEWVRELRECHAWGDTDPLFPATEVGLGPEGQFVAMGLKRTSWGNADPIRKIFRIGFDAAGLPYFNPHSFRNALVQLGQRVCATPEAFKVWSENLGHEKVLTTFTSYGAVPVHRRAEIMRSLRSDASGADGVAALLASVGLQISQIKNGSAAL